MTEYWVSQGNKWCDFCKIYIANNPLSIRTHELGQRHKDNVAKRLTAMKKESAAKEKEEKQAFQALEEIEDKAKRSYQKDLAAFKDTNDSNQKAQMVNKGFPKQFTSQSKDWEYDAASGYYYNLASRYYYDSNSGLYYSSALGKWVKHEEACPSSHSLRYGDNCNIKLGENVTSKHHGGQPTNVVIPKPVNPVRSVKGASSSTASSKRRREDEKSKAVSKEEAAALKAREAARKRVEEREKNLLGLYNSY